MEAWIQGRCLLAITLIIYGTTGQITGWSEWYNCGDDWPSHGGSDTLNSLFIVCPDEQTSGDYIWYNASLSVICVAPAESDALITGFADCTNDCYDCSKMDQSTHQCTEKVNDGQCFTSVDMQISAQFVNSVQFTTSDGIATQFGISSGSHYSAIGAPDTCLIGFRGIFRQNGNGVYGLYSIRFYFEYFTPIPAPTSGPTQKPTQQPTSSPTQTPYRSPTKSPTQPPTTPPTTSPTEKPTSSPTKTAAPTISQTAAPTTQPSDFHTTSGRREGEKGTLNPMTIIWILSGVICLFVLGCCAFIFRKWMKKRNLDALGQALHDDLSIGPVEQDRNDMEGRVVVEQYGNVMEGSIVRGNVVDTAHR